MPKFQSDSALHDHYGLDVFFAPLRLPNAFDQWIEAKNLIERDNPGVGPLQSTEHEIYAGIDRDERAVCYLTRVGHVWITTNEGHALRPSGRAMLAAAIHQANRRGLSHAQAS